MEGKPIVTIIPSFAERYPSNALFEGMRLSLGCECPLSLPGMAGLGKSGRSLV